MPTLSRRHLQAILGVLKGRVEPIGMDLISIVERALRPSPKKRAVRKAKKVTRADKRAAKAEETAFIRKYVGRRSYGRCELRDPDSGQHCAADASEMDHFFSRRHGQSVETCWALCRAHHHLKTNSVPDAAWWLRAFVGHCAEYGYRTAALQAENRLAFVRARKAGAA